MTAFSSFRRHRQLAWATLLGFAVVAPAYVHAVDGSHGMQQYLRRQWGAAEGLAGTPVTAIAQTPDGYLWVGTVDGLFRFDGIHFEQIQPPREVSGAIGHVLGLTVGSKGALWIRMQGSRVLRVVNNHFTAVQDVNRGELAVTSMAPARGGGILTTGISEGVVYLPDDEKKVLPIPVPSLLISVAQTDDDRIWLGTRETGLLFWQNNVLTPVTEGIPDKKINCLLPIGAGRMWVGTDNGLAFWNGHTAITVALPVEMSHLQILAMVQDRDGNLWAGTSRGLLRYNAGGAYWLPRAAHDRNTAVTALVEDREGDLWFSNGQHLERLRDSPLVTYGDAELPPSDQYGATYADNHGRIWFAPVTGGLYWMREDEAPHKISAAGLDQDVVYSLDGHGDDIWIGRQQGGLTELHGAGDSFSARTWTRKEGLAEDSVFALRADRNGSVWAGTLTAGVSHLAGGKISNYTPAAKGLLTGTINAVEEASDGSLWFGTPEGISILRNGIWTSVKKDNGLPSPDITTLLATADDGMWIGTASGLAFAEHGRLHTFNLPALSQEAILGLGIDRQRQLWVATGSHIAGVPLDLLLKNRATAEDVRFYGPQDGLHSTAGVRRFRSVVSDSMGRVWLATASGLSVTSPVTAARAPQALSHVEGVSADGEPLALSAEPEVSARLQRIAFNYAGLDLRAPENVRFRYLLENFDRHWSAPTDSHEAVYTNLPPGHYRFHVMATNSDGQWSSQESVLDLHVYPLLWERWEFQIGCALVLLVIGIWIYRARMQYLISQTNIRFEERLIERSRIARELHDTLLQGFQGLILYFQTATDRIAPDHPARPMLEQALSDSDRVMVEGRDRIRNLRSTMTEATDLQSSLTRIGEELRRVFPADFDVMVIGESREMVAILQEEVLQITREALNNAFRHSDATAIRAEIHFDPAALRVVIRDDGIGIDPDVLRTGSKYGHWGLPGMRERAKKIRAQLTIMNNHPGTVVELNIPGSVIYQARLAPRFVRWMRRLLKSEQGAQMFR